MAEVQQPSAEALKQKRKRAKKAAEDSAKGVELVQIEMAGGFKASIKRLMKEHGFNNQQEVYQNLLRNVLDADFETAAQMLRCVTTPFEITQEVSQHFINESLLLIHKDPGDEIIGPQIKKASADEMPFAGLRSDTPLSDLISVR